jgi:transposase
VSVAELCRSEGTHPAIYYKWLKDFMEAGKARIAGRQPAGGHAGRSESLKIERFHETLKVV